MYEIFTIEKRNSTTKIWETVTTLGYSRYAATAALVGSKIFVFGGGPPSIDFFGSWYNSTFDFFDLKTKKWASQDVGCAYFDEAKRKMPRQVADESRAVLVTPPEAKNKVWTSISAAFKSSVPQQQQPDDP